MGYWFMGYWLVLCLYVADILVLLRCVMLQMAKHQKLVDQLTNSTQKNIVKEKKMNCNWNSLMRETLQRMFNFLLRAYSSTGKFIYLGYVCWEECCSS